MVKDVIEDDCLLQVVCVGLTPVFTWWLGRAGRSKVASCACLRPSCWRAGCQLGSPGSPCVLSCHMVSCFQGLSPRGLPFSRIAWTSLPGAWIPDRRSCQASERVGPELAQQSLLQILLISTSRRANSGSNGQGTDCLMMGGTVMCLQW